jgi:polyisoprenoid-binding protein YceI
MKSNSKTIALLTLATACLALTSFRSAADTVRYDPKPGSKLRLEGTSVVHDYAAESKLIHGFLEVGSNFPTEPGQKVAPGKVEAKGQASVAVRQLYTDSDGLNNKMWDMLRMDKNPMIVFQIRELTLKELPKGTNDPYVFDATGDLAVAGVTNQIAMPVNVFLLPDKKLKITGTKPLKMTDFKIEPAKLILPQFKTSDDVTIKFEWILGPRKPAAPAAK